MAQANQTVTPIRPPSAAGTIYLPEVHAQAGNYFPETDMARCGMADVVADIVSGELTKVQRVIAVSVGGSECWDASMAIAAAVLVKSLNDFDRVPEWCENFCEWHLGVHNVRQTEHEYRNAA